MPPCGLPLMITTNSVPLPVSELNASSEMISEDRGEAIAGDADSVSDYWATRPSIHQRDRKNELWTMPSAAPSLPTASDGRTITKSAMTARPSFAYGAPAGSCGTGRRSDGDRRTARTAAWPTA